MLEQNKALELHLIDEAFNQGNLAVADELVASDCVVHSGAADIHGSAGVKQYVADLREAFPDLQITIEDQIAEGDQVVTRWTARGTHTGVFQGIPPTGKPGTVTGISIDRIANSKVVESWENMDDLGLLHQLGVVPAPEEVASA